MAAPRGTPTYEGAMDLEVLHFGPTGTDAATPFEMTEAATGAPGSYRGPRLDNTRTNFFADDWEDP